MTSSAANLVRIAAGLAFFVISAVCGLWSTIIYWEIMEKVNARLPEAEKFHPLFWGPLKRTRLNEQYRRLFPDGNELKRMHRLVTIMFAALAFLMISFLL
jgi:hypothetical protein